jgi:tRNA G46 methylase TrmB
MSLAHPSRRSVYADKLGDFADLAFGDAAAFARRGRWADYFRHRIGPAFDGRVVFEVGCSDAGLLSRVAAKHPVTGFVGLDWKAKSLYDAAGRVAGLGLANVALLRGRGQDVRRIFADGEVDEVWVFHPDPCDRDVELKNRLIAEPFLCDVREVLRDGRSTLSLKTDHPGYYQWVLGLFGLPEPAWFRAARDRSAAGPSSAMADAPPPAPVPRVRARDLMRPEDVPATSGAVRQRFEVVMTSADYWNDPAALAHTAGRGFAGEVTFFESRFVRKRQPIYYVEVRRR